MNIEAPAIAQRLFARLCRGDNLLLSSNGSAEDADLFRQLEADEDPCRSFFLVLGFHLRRGDNCYYFTVDDEAPANIEGKLDKTIRLMRLLDFLSTHVENFGEGVIFSAPSVAARCNAERRQLERRSADTKSRDPFFQRRRIAGAPSHQCQILRVGNRTFDRNTARAG